jgi:ubiquinone/menaquinone biosynthesis C-methylase UbiE
MSNVYNVFVDRYTFFPTSVRKPMWQIWHKLLNRFDRDSTVNFMNYGYESLNGHIPIPLEDQDEINRYCIQLYDHVVQNVDLLNKDVLEVGSGRGGGASYISRYYKPRTYTGLDISSSVIKFCNRHYDVEGLSFIKGSSQNQPFPDKSFDALVNVESARCYGNLEGFFREVKRVLRPGGYFLFADVVDKGEIGSIRNKLIKCGFNTEKEEEITANVVRALEKDTGRREKLVEDKIPGFLQKSFIAFAGAQGTHRYNAFANESLEYWSFVLKA